jgi:hypothetical protein
MRCSGTGTGNFCAVIFDIYAKEVIYFAPPGRWPISSRAITDVGNGWNRRFITFTPTASGTTTLLLGFLPTGKVSAYNGDDIPSSFSWGVQVETGLSVTPYVSTQNDLKWSYYKTVETSYTAPPLQ